MEICNLDWVVTITSRAAKKARNLPIGAMNAFRLLWKDLEQHGPVQPQWPNFGKLKGSSDRYHCHLKKGRPTYVVCWSAQRYSKGEAENEKGEVKIYYAWTHEKAPY